MSKSLVQFRIDKEARDKASEICKKLGFDLQTYLRMSITKLIKYNGVPFDLFAIDETDQAYISLQEAREEAKRNGTCNLTEEEIEAEIALSRKERRERSK